MSKEQLRQIENRVFSRTFHTGLGVDMITIPERDYIYLKKQAERVRELEKEVELLNKKSRLFHDDLLETTVENTRMKEQNKRYREAIKKAMNELVAPGMTKTNVYRTLNFALEGE